MNGLEELSVVVGPQAEHSVVVVVACKPARLGEHFSFFFLHLYENSNSLLVNKIFRDFQRKVALGSSRHWRYSFLLAEQSLLTICGG